MTGTAIIEAADIYNLNVVSIPTNREMIRKDFNDQILELRKKNILQLLIRYSNVKKINLF